MFFQQIQMDLLQFIQKEQRLPSSSSFDPFERDLAHTTYNYHKKYSDGLLHPKIIQRFKDAYPKFFGKLLCTKRQKKKALTFK